MSDVLIDKERALQLLGEANLSNEVVASTLGCSPGYISQLMADDLFRERVSALRMQALTANSARDRKIDSIEDDLLHKLEELTQYIVKPGDALRAFQVVNAAKRRGLANHESTIINNNIVNLVMPQVVMQKFTKNGMNEVVEVGDRPLITIDSNKLLRDVAGEQLNPDKRAQIEKIARSLPSAITEQLAVRDSKHDTRVPTRADYEQQGIVREA